MNKYFNGQKVTEKQLRRILLLRKIVSNPNSMITTQDKLIELYNNHEENKDHNGNPDVLDKSRFNHLLSIANIYKTNITNKKPRKKSSPSKYICHDFIDDDIANPLTFILRKGLISKEYIPAKSVSNLYLTVKNGYETAIANELFQNNDSKDLILFLSIGYNSINIKVRTENIDTFMSLLDV